ncbi:Uncharacterised protein [Mycobacteroides abscessus subsp. abscessus]|nr:Uncharacterised protein [Mycobacteroides abscessus subsp. abscessus]
MKATHNRLNQLQSALDRKLADHWHELERHDLSDMEGQKFLQEVQETVRSRRLVKDELARLSPIHKMLREQAGTLEDQYTRAVRRSFEIRAELNVSGNLADVLERYPACGSV